MRTLLVLLNIFVASSLFSQSFTDITGDSALDAVSYGAVAFADVDNDGDKDVFITGEIENGVLTAKLYVNDGSGIFSEVQNTPFRGTYNGDVAFADFNGDGNQDLIIVGGNASEDAFVELYLNQGMLNFTKVNSTNLDGVLAGTVAVADIDNDGDPDLSIAGAVNSVGPSVKFYRNDGAANFSETSSFSGQFGGIVTGATAFYDADGDGDQDCQAIGGPNPQSTSKLYLNDGNGIFETAPLSQFRGLYDTALGVADIDGDNDIDVLVSGSFMSHIIDLYTNDGSADFTRQMGGVPFRPVVFGTIDFSDLDKDGDSDVVITGDSPGFLGGIAHLYLNDGDGNFSQLMDTPFSPVYQSAVALADVDGDGDDDVLLTGFSGSDRVTKLYRNNLVTSSNNDRERKANSSILIYPNPNSDNNLKIDYHSTGEKELEITISDVEGRVALRKESVLSVGENTLEIKELNLSPGVYFVDLKSEFFISTSKIIIQ